jgi:hypothetical protein
LRGWGEREGAEWVVREGVGAGGEMTQALYAHMNNKTIKHFLEITSDVVVHACNPTLRRWRQEDRKLKPAWST